MVTFLLQNSTSLTRACPFGYHMTVSVSIVSEMNNGINPFLFILDELIYWEKIISEDLVASQFYSSKTSFLKILQSVKNSFSLELYDFIFGFSKRIYVKDKCLIWLPLSGCTLGL